MRYTVILVPAEDNRISASVPAMPGCFSSGRTRDEALANILDAMTGWFEAEAQQKRGPLHETPSILAAGVSIALEMIDEMRQAGEIPADYGYQLELVTVETRQPVAA
jgi:antitoxin HicB